MSQITKNNIINKTRQLDNGMYVIDVGYRNDQPVALVKHNIHNSYEYIIAFNYKIKDNKMDWGYGYYYDTDLEKAKNDFEKVLKGESLSNTFSNENDEMTI